MEERGVEVDHSTFNRWVLTYGGRALPCSEERVIAQVTACVA
jgi:transposase-like protein